MAIKNQGEDREFGKMQSPTPINATPIKRPEVMHQLDRLSDLTLELTEMSEKLDVLINFNELPSDEKIAAPTQCHVADLIAASCSRVDQVIEKIKALEI